MKHSFFFRTKSQPSVNEQILIWNSSSPNSGKCKSKVFCRIGPRSVMIILSQGLDVLRHGLARLHGQHPHPSEPARGTGSQWVDHRDPQQLLEHRPGRPDVDVRGKRWLAPNLHVARRRNMDLSGSDRGTHALRQLYVREWVRLLQHDNLGSIVYCNKLETFVYENTQ